MTEKLWLDRRHPAYSDALPHWTFCRESYEGGPAYFRPNLIKFRLEYDEDFEERLKKACRYNFTAQSVGLVTGHLLKVAPTRKPELASEAVRRFWGRATKDGDNIDTFARAMTDWSSVYGRLYVVIDVPSDGGEAPKTEAERLARGLEPYAYWVSPEDVLNLAFDGKGELLWALIRERFRDDADPMKVSETIEERYRLWERGKWSLWRKVKGDGIESQKAEKIAEGVIPFGSKIPIVILEHKDGGEYTSPGLVDDLVYIDRSIFNLMSELDETIAYQAFNQLIIPSDAVPESPEAEMLLAMGKKRIFTYNAEAKTAPSFIAPDASQGHLILDTIDRRCTQAYDSVNLGDEVGGSGKQVGGNVSGVTMAYRFAKLESGLGSKAGEMEEAERKIANIVDLWSGGEGKLPDPIVTYSRKFDVVALQQALQDAMSVEAVLGGASTTALAEQRKQIVSKALERVEPEVMQAITEEIDAAAAADRLTVPDDDGEGEGDGLE